jgi:thioredoxin-like negative regulator of GroEL
MKTLLKFGATWCSNCKTLDKVLEQVDLNDCLLTPIDIDVDPELTKELNVRMLPTVVLLDTSGVEIKRFTGVKSKEFVLEFIS